MNTNLAEREKHMQLLDLLLGDKAKNRETLFDYDFGRDTRPSTLSSGREFYRVEITTLNHNHNPVRFNWFYHSDLNRERWLMTSLSLRGLGLEIINTSVLSEFTKLEYLDLQGNFIREFLFKHIMNCDNLHSINLSSNLLTSIDSSNLKYLTKLRYFNLFNNKLQSFDLKALISCPSLNRIIISNNNIKKIDLDPISYLRYLIVLDLSHNSLTSIDISLRNKRLQNIILNDNQLDEVIINSKIQLPKLTVINLSNNNLSNLNLMELISLPQLQKIYLWGNELTEGFMISDENDKLEEINLNSNQITKFAMRGNFLALKELELAYNNIKELDLSEIKVPQLEYLNLSCNPLLELKLPDFTQMNCIEMIDLLGTDINNLVIKISYDGIDAEDKEIGRFKFRQYRFKVSNNRYITINLPLNTKIMYN